MCVCAGRMETSVEDGWSVFILLSGGQSDAILGMSRICAKVLRRSCLTWKGLERVEMAE